MNSPCIETPYPQPLAVHLVNNRSNPALSPLVGWDAFADRLTAHNERDDKDGPGFIGAEFHTMRRSKSNVSAYDALTLDIEGKDPENLPPMPEDVADLMRRRNLEGVVYTSHNHLTPPELNGNKPASPRYRVVVPLSAPVPPDDMPRHVTALADALGLSPWLDPASLVVSQFFYLPSCRPGAPRFAARIHGDPWDATAPAALPEIMPTRGGGYRLDFTPLPPSSADRGFDAVRKAAQGQWRGVLSRLGISVPDTAKHAPCPGCGGRDRFRFDDKDGGGSFICGQGGAGTLAGDGFALVQHVRHCSAADALALVREVVLPSSGGSTRQERPANDEPEAPEEWPAPMPLVKHYLPEEYPLDSLPDTIRAAVEEVAGFVKAPIPLVASSALAALSLACQAHADIKRAEKLHGPISLYMLAIADSGERKTTCDGFFMSAIRQFEREQTEAMKPAIQQYEAAFAAWDAEREGILSAIRDAGKKGKPTHKMREDLEQLQLSKPESPPVPRLLLEDETPENLVWSLAKQWPSSGIISSEAGMVLGSHAMGRDSVMRNLATLNIVWDGGEFSIGRKTTESFKMRGGRATIALQTQEATLHNFLEKSGDLARGTGFLARFLVSWPASTQGSRMFTEAPMHWPHLSAFHARITAMLSQPFTLDEDGMLTPPIMSLSRGAKDAWIEYHDTIERGLTHGGELGDVRDVASKSADNAARLAALFQMFESGFSPVSQDVFDRASTIAAWHLSESRRFLGGFSLPREMGDATKLDGWIVEHCCKSGSATVGKNYARQHGPIRDSSRLDAAIRELVELDRVRLEKDGKKTMIQVNPRLMR